MPSRGKFCSNLSAVPTRWAVVLGAESRQRQIFRGADPLSAGQKSLGDRFRYGFFLCVVFCGFVLTPQQFYCKHILWKILIFIFFSPPWHVCVNRDRLSCSSEVYFPFQLPRSRGGLLGKTDGIRAENSCSSLKLIFNA